jgi:hypothetical protein
MSAMNGKTIRADMFVDGVRIGRASASLDTFDTQTNTSSTTILDLETSNTLDLLYDLKAGQQVNTKHYRPFLNICVIGLHDD